MTTRSVCISSLREHPMVECLPRWADDSPELEALAQDVRLRGIDQPLQVVPDPAGCEDAWLLVDGRHRLRAARMAGLDAVPCHVCDEAQAVDIVLNSLVQRRHYSRGALAYVCYPVLAGNRRDRKANLRRGNSPNPLQAVSGGIDEICTRLGISPDTWERAERLHRIFQEDNDYRQRVEPRFLAGEVGLGAAIAGFAGDGADQSSTPHKKLQKGRIFAERLKACWNGFFEPRKWERIPVVEKGRVAAEAGKAIAKWPPEVREAVARALNTKGGK